jgi:hypothetical protein
MSLLLDALKRAEQEKQARPEPAAGKPALELAPLPSAPQAGAAPRSATGASGPAPSQMASPPKAASATRSRKALWIAGVAIVLLIAAGAGYVWYAISALSPSVARAPAVRPLPPPVLPAPMPAPPVATTESPVAPAPAAKAAPPENRAPRAVPVDAQVATRPAPAAVLQPSRAADRPRIAPEVAAGYESLRRGDLAAARRDYTAALTADPANLDAVLGLATVEARGGRMDVAVILYRPRARNRPEERNRARRPRRACRPHAARRPRAPARARDRAEPAFGVAAFHARQRLRRAVAVDQAQTSYFEAHRLDPANPTSCTTWR